MVLMGSLNKTTRSVKRIACNDVTGHGLLGFTSPPDKSTRTHPQALIPRPSVTRVTFGSSGNCPFLSAELLHILASG